MNGYRIIAHKSKYIGQRRGIPGIHDPLPLDVDFCQSFHVFSITPVAQKEQTGNNNRGIPANETTQTVLSRQKAAKTT
jgi:hypothetical protein